MTDLADRFVGNCACQDAATGELHYHGVRIWIKGGRAGFRICDGDGGHPVRYSFDDPAAVDVFMKFIGAMRENHALTCGKQQKVAS